MKESKVCSVCGASLKDEPFHDVGGRRLCDDCYCEHTVVCDCCGERIMRNEAEGDNMVTLCRHCYEYNYTFGFKGGEFGNWMSAKDRQVSLDYGFDALKDLADVLGIEDTDISFGGNLSIAFGARGQGLSGAAAHYENLRRVINLTKMNGAGSLAHEWFHALDDFIGGYTNNYATNNQHTLPENTKTAIRNLITAMRYRDATQEETDLAQQHRYERAVKSVTYQLETLFKWVKKVEDGTLTDYDVQHFKRKPTKADAEKYRRLYNSLIETGDKAYIKELSKLRKEVYGHVISAEDTVNLEMRLLPLTPEAKNNVQLTRKATDFYNNSQRFGQLHSKDGDYWDSTIEMAARAFACYVADKTHKQNDYLSAHSDNAITLDMDKTENPVIRAFPVGEERIAINAAFDDLFAALKTDGFLHEREQTEKPSEISYSLEAEEDADYSLESEDGYGETRDLLHDGSEQRHDSERARKQVAGVVKAAEKGSETAEERKSFTEGLTAEQLEEKILTDGDGNRHKYVEIKKEAWNQSMNDIADFYAKKGVNVHFLKGNVEIAFAGTDRAARAMRVGNDIYISFDHATFTPEQLAMHEYVHIQYQSEEVQSAKKAIFDKMSVEEKRALIDKIKEAYGDTVTDNDKLEEEAVCNILSGMYRNAKHQDVVNSFWSTETDAIDNFKVAEYTESIDAGGEKSSVKDGEENVSEDSQTLDNERTRENNDSVWERSADTEGIYTRLGNREMVLRRGEEGRRGFVDWSGKIQSDSNPTRKAKRTAGILREISKRRIADSDAQGRPLSEHVKQYFAETVAKDAEGRLIPLYHATPAEFTEFSLGDFAFHIGSLEQAMHFGHKYIKEVYINVKNPMYIDGDTMRWPGLVIANKAVEQGIFSEKEYEFVSKLEGFRGNDYNAPANVIIREVLESKGYDGVIYDNDIEGNGISFIVFNSNQIKYVSNQNPTADKRINYSLDTDGIADLDDLIAEYGEIEPGENPAREVHVPKKISETRYVSRFARTMMEAGVTPDDEISEFEERILNGTLTHEPITNDAARESAVEKIKYLGFKDAMKEWEVLSRSGKVGKKELALGMELYNQCITNKDVYNAMKIAAELTAEATRAGQTLQACRMLKLMSPDGQLYYLEKSVEKMNAELRELIGDKFEGIKFDEDLMRKFFEAKDEAERDAAYDALCQNIADQIPATMRDKWNSWRYLAMLGNPRTHIRNIVGNAVFMPAMRMKTYIGAVLERAFKVDATERTKSLFKSKEAVEFAKNDFAAMQSVLQGENAKYAVTNDIEGKRTIFKTRWLEALRTKNFEWLEKEDIWFLKAHYIDALARLLTVRKIDPSTITPDALEKIRAIAVREAQAATYRDANALADALTKMERNINRSGSKPLKLAGFVLEGVMPFKKTPLNIAKQGVAYSPVGILSAVYKGAKKLQNGKAYSATDVIEDLSKGLTGTAIMALGVLLAGMGWISGGDDEDKKKKAFDKMVGEQSYALRIGDKSYTIDWMTPSCLPMFIGVELYNLAKDEFSFRDIMDATGTLTEPLLELSVFSGVSDAIATAQYNSSNELVAVLTDAVSSYFMQALPTLGGQASRIIDKNKRQYYFKDKNSELPGVLQTFIGQAASKIPFASFLFETSVDNWGRVETYGNVFERAFENTVSPGYYSEENYTKVDYELRRLYAQTGDNAVFPTTQVKYYVVGGVRYDMTAEDYTAVKKYRGKLSFKLVKELINSKTYKAMSDEEKAKAIAKCYEQAGKETKTEMLDRVKACSNKE